MHAYLNREYFAKCEKRINKICDKLLYTENERTLKKNEQNIQKDGKVTGHRILYFEKH